MALRNKLRNNKFSIRQRIIGILTLAAALLWWLAEQLWSDTVVDYVKNYVPLSQIVIPVLAWSSDHPGEISLTVFFLTATYLGYQIVKQVQPSARIEVTVAESETYFLDKGGLKITNLTGSDLKNCTVSILRVNGKNISSHVLPWGDEGFYENPIDIFNGGSANIFLNDVFHDIKEKIENDMFVFPVKASEIELFFRGNTITGETKSMSIWVKMNGKVVKNEPFIGSYRVIIEGIETSRPEFGV